MLRNHEHATDTQNNGHGTLSAEIHAQVPDQRHRKQSDSQVGNSGSDTVQVRDTGEGIFMHARAMSARLRPVPEIVDGGALENGDEEKDEANGSGQRHSGVEDVGVDARDSDSEEGDDDRDFGDDAG